MTQMYKFNQKNKGEHVLIVIDNIGQVNDK